MATTTKNTKTAAPAKKLDSVNSGVPTGTKIGIVESDKRAKTRTVVVNYQSMHPKYGKYVKNRTVLQVHDEKNESQAGDVVEVGQCRPISKSKTWKLVRIVEQRGAKAAALASAKAQAEAKPA
jgi:small subunit ribosomal protein S17